MTPQEQSKILDALRQDNVAAFEAAVGKRKNLCFGRFPLLSIAYLYHSTKIVAKYEQAMRQDNPQRLPELPALYADFAPLAGKALRLWAGAAKHDVTPLEMLAVTGQWHTLRTRFARYVGGKDEQNRLLLVLKLRYGVSASIHNGQLELPPKPLPQYTLRQWRWGLVATLVLVMLGVVFTALGMVYHLGVPVRSAENLRALAAGKQYSLEQDISIEGTLDWQDATILGNGHTLTLTVQEEPLLATFAGRVQDLTVVLQTQDVTIADEYAMLCATNMGTWQNVRFVLEGEHTITLQEKQTTSDEEEDAVNTVALGLVFATNMGTIRHCTIKGRSTWIGVASRDGQLGTLASHNEGVIEGCDVNVVIGAQTIDIGGVAFQNDGRIADCTLHGDTILVQLTNAYWWSPMVGGVACTNYGTIESCEQAGTIKSLRQNVILPDDTSQLRLVFSYAGGIVVHNYGMVRHNAAIGEIQSGGSYCIAYVGGVAATSEYDTPAPDDEDDTNVVETKKLHEGVLAQNVVTATVYGTGYYNYVGGICGASDGPLEANCFAGLVGYNSMNNPDLGLFLGLGNYADTSLIRNNHCRQLRYADDTTIPVVGFWTATEQACNELEGVSLHNLEITGLEEYWYDK